jgi:hypothetical protein
MFPTITFTITFTYNNFNISILEREKRIILKLTTVLIIMCKVGILLIGLDLYHSASTLFQRLILHQTDSSASPLDLAVHIIALMTLLLAYRGRVRRSIAGKVVLPVMMVNGFKQLIAGQFITFGGEDTTTTTGSNNVLEWSFFDNASTTNYERLMVVKCLLFCSVMARVAFQGDNSCVGKDEWFPWQNQFHCGDGAVVGDEKEMKKKE